MSEHGRSTRLPGRTAQGRQPRQERRQTTGAAAGSLCGGNPHALATVRVPTPEEEQKRIESRQREQLKREVKRVAAQGRSLLLTQGQREKKGWWEDRRWRRLAVERLECFRRVLSTLTAELDAATAALEAAAPALRPKGLGGLTLRSGRTRDWGLASFHQPTASGQLHRPVRRSQFQRQQPASLADHQTWQRAAAHRAGGTGLAVGGMAARLCAGQEMETRLWQPEGDEGRQKKAIVAMARQMAVDLWRWRTGRVPAQTFGWTMVGTET